ncbi:hypothetical protein CABS01_16908 [Colletotrichum abscissum]|nr:uncharacterized protein CABS01_16908 [Colletotrichum abscissum]KAK1506530.1 hypothetical protein CABS01_16908 [Colletotrichum abscissum]
MTRSICVPRLCGLCRFELHLGDDIVAGKSSTPFSVPVL